MNKEEKIKKVLREWYSHKIPKGICNINLDKPATEKENILCEGKSVIDEIDCIINDKEYDWEK